MWQNRLHCWPSTGAPWPQDYVKIIGGHLLTLEVFEISRNRSLEPDAGHFGWIKWISRDQRMAWDGPHIFTHNLGVSWGTSEPSFSPEETLHFLFFYRHVCICSSLARLWNLINSRNLRCIKLHRTAHFLQSTVSL